MPSMVSQTLETLQSAFSNLSFKASEPLSSHTYMKSGGPAEIFVVVTKKADLENLVIWCEKNQQKYLVLGGMSNSLVPDEGIKGLVINNMVSGSRTIQIDENTYSFEVESGTPTNLAVRASINKSLEGLEYFLGVPGTIGGAIYNNSHYLTELIGADVDQVEVIAKGGIKKIYTKNEMQFAYDYSILQETHEVITTVRFKLKKGNKAELEQKAAEATKRRADTQPLGIPSSGCMFKNPVMPSGLREGAGKLIDGAGLKGMRIGDAVISDKHASFILNTGHATTSDVLKLAEHVKAVVKEKYGVELEREVFLVG